MCPDSAGAPRRLAALDIGSNSLRSIVAEVLPEGGFHILDSEKITARLGQGLALTGLISEEAQEEAVQGLAHLKAIAEGLGCHRIRAVGTSAMREAANGAEFAQRIRRQLGLDLKVVDGEEEARLALRSARHAFDLRDEPVGLVDVGGGSADLMASRGEVIEMVASLPLGALRLTEAFLSTDPPRRKDVKRMRRHTRRALEQGVEVTIPGGRIVASGGTANSLARIVLWMQGERYDQAHGTEIPRSSVEHVYRLLRDMDSAQRKRLKGLSPDRSDIMLAGVLVLREVMRAFEANWLLINEGGVREGVVLEMIEEDFPRRTTREGAPPEPMASALRFARTCRFDARHAETTLRLALIFFDSLAPLHGLAEADREVLELAAVLHDVGYLIGFPRHHKHSYHLITNAPLRRIDPRRKEMTALVARYHRRALPKPSHSEFSRLPARDREVVSWLAGILRLADGLDRGHYQRIEAVRLEADEGSIVVRLQSADQVDLEIWGARRKCDLLERISGRRVTLVQTHSIPAEEAGGWIIVNSTSSVTSDVLRVL